jgi:tetratricopeptide (TPR) repeat protein
MRCAVLALTCLLTVAAGQQDAAGVRVYESEITIPTYPWKGHDDINPQFRWTSNPMYSRHTTTYPYPMQDTLSHTKENHTYKTMVVENEWLKVTVIPELGGHVHQVLDKVTGESMLYENKVIKPSLIGLRGAWTSGGIEFNTGPQGHTVTCLSPVEAKFVEFADGSKGIAIGNVEQVYHTQWVATVKLRPGRSFLEEKIRIYNPTGNRHIYYFWNCVAVPNTPTSQFVYPMTLGTDHAGTTFFSWPVHDGKDISWLKNFDKPTSVFAYRCDQDFYGWYDHGPDRGVIAHANHFELIGKKSWTWSMSTWGQRAQEALTDDGSLYNEIQTGPLPTQADYGVLEPHMTVEWDEWWRPVRGTKGVAFSTKDVSVNVEKDGSGTALRLFPSGTWDATVSVEGVGEQKVQLSPAKASVVNFPAAKEGPLNITVKAGGDVLAKFTHPLKLPQRTKPENPRQQPSEDTAAGCYLRGIWNDKEGAQNEARDYFEKAIEKDKNFAPAYSALGELELEAGEYEDAKGHLEQVLKLTPDDGWAMYYLAQAYLELGQPADAMEIAAVAARRPESACPAYSLMGSIYLRQGEVANAIEFLKKALDKDAEDLVSRDLLAYAYWKSGNREAADHELADVQRRDPLDMPAAIIAGFMGKQDVEFAKRISGRKEEVLDAADFFMNAGLRDDAARVLERYYLSVEKKEPEPMVYYTYAWLTGQSKMPADLGPDYFFPSRRSSFAILESAIKKNPKDWMARYALGNACFERARKKDAVRLWKEAAKLNDGYSVVHRNLGLVAWKVDKHLWQAIAHYEKAVACNADDFTLYRDLGTLYLDVDRPVAAKELLEKARAKKCTRADVVTLLGKAYVSLGEFDKTVELLLADKYTNWEGQFSLNALWYQAKIGIGERLFAKGEFAAALKEFEASLDAPKSLGAGQMVDAPSAEAYYWVGRAQEKLGNAEAAAKAFKRAAEETKKGDERNKKFAREAEERVAERK